MKRRITIVSITMAAAALLFIAGYFILNTEPPARIINNSAELYTNAVTPFQNANNITVNVSKTRQTTTNGSSLTESVNQIISVNNSDTLKVEETSTIGTHSVNITEYFSESTAYVQIKDGLFSCNTNIDDYRKRLTPAVLIDSNLYQNITGIDDGKQYIITFSQPSDPEGWCAKAAPGFLNATGTAYVSHDGTLTQSVYEITYTQGNAIITLKVIAMPELSAEEIVLPENLTQYIPISYFDGPRTLERATGYLIGAQEISAVYNDSIYFQAFGEERTQSISLFTSGASNWSALVNTEIALNNDARNDNITNSKTELFLGGQYKSSENGGDYNISTDVSTDNMRTYCQNLLVSTVMLPHHITDAQVTEKENTLLISFTASNEFAQIISENACQSMYQNPNLLHEQAQENVTDALNCYLEIDKMTGFPVSSGIHYTGTYLMESIPYLLRFNAEQTYDIISLTAKNEIEKAAG